jgi:hypothetical protein
MLQVGATGIAEEEDCSTEATCWINSLNRIKNHT